MSPIGFESSTNLRLGSTRRLPTQKLIYESSTLVVVVVIKIRHGCDLKFYAREDTFIVLFRIICYQEFVLRSSYKGIVSLQKPQGQQGT